MSKKKAIAFGVKTAQNPSLFAGLVGTLLEIIMGSCILMIVLSPVFIWMYGFEAIQGYVFIIGVLIVITLFIFYEPSNKSKSYKSNKFKIDKRKSKKIKKSYSEIKSCPNCGKEINKKAIRCKYCKTMLKTY